LPWRWPVGDARSRECQVVSVASEPIAAPKRDVGLCLSGGGYRAAVFHLGSLIRLNEAGLLRRLRTVSSVSGGSIIAGLLGLRWIGSMITSPRLPARPSGPNWSRYRGLFGMATPADLPHQAGPDFVITA